ncbi:hypothetical protein BpHYR1_045352, partial [Brachionus plicatilis]
MGLPGSRLCHSYDNKFCIHLILLSAYDYRFSKNNRINHKNDNPITNNNNNTTSSEQHISYYSSDDTDVEAEEIEAP